MNIPANFNVTKQAKAMLEKEYEDASAAFHAIPGIGSGPMGLTPDSIKATPEYKKLRAEMEKANNALRNFNGVYCKQFAKELRAERANKGKTA